MSGEDDKIVDFTLPQAIRDFVFDLHDAVRRSRGIEEVQRLYETRLKEMSDKYFSQSTWPEAKAIASEVYNDEFFLLLYSEMATRHVTTKLKPQLSHHIASWNNYKKLFEMIANSTNDSFLISTQWVYDITQEFAYQFQGFCQYRGQVASHNAENIRLLQANRDAWTLPEVMGLLNKLIKAGRLETSPVLVPNQSPVLKQFAYFATIELARLDCLLGDHASSLQHFNNIKLSDRSDLFMSLPICYFNVMYHVGVCNMMLKRYPCALDAFSDVIPSVSRILKPGGGASSAARSGAPAQLSRMLDKALSLVAILLVLCPAYPVEDPIREVVEAKFADKMRRLREGDRHSAVELFESACPKFISPAVPDYSNPVNTHNAVFEHLSSVFIQEVMQHVPFLKLCSFLSMYTSVDLSKLARFMEMSEADLIALLLAYKNKVVRQSVAAAGSSGSSSGSGSSSAKNPRAASAVFQFSVQGGVLVVEATPSKSSDLAYERFFVAGVKKHREIAAHLNQTLANLGF